MRASLTGLGGPSPLLRRVSAAWFLVNFAEWAYVTALSIHEYHRHGPLALGLIGARFVPSALLGSVLLGALGRRPAPRVLQGLSLMRCVALGLVAVALIGHLGLWVVVVIVWADAVIGAPYRPVQAALLPALASTPRELSAVAGSVPSVKALAQAAGALTGSLLLSILSPQTVLVAAVAAFVLTAALVAGISTEPLVMASDAEDGLASASTAKRLREVRAGFRLIAERAMPLLVLGGMRSLTRGVWTSLAVVVSLRLLGLGSAGVGLLMAAAGVGAAVAVPASMRFAGRPRLAGPAAAAFVMAGLPIVLVGVIASPVPAVVLIVVWGLAFALADSVSNALIHRVVEAHRLAPSVAALESSKLLLEGLGALAAPALLSLVGIRDALVIAGAPLPVLVVLSWRGLLATDDRAAARTRPLAALRRTPSFHGLTMLSLENLAARLQPSTVGQGEVIIRENELGDRFYLIDTGRVGVTIDGFSVSELGPGQGFGEKALLRDTPRSATVAALEPTTVWSMDGTDFVAAATGTEGSVVQRLEQDGGDTVEDLLSGVPLFAAFDKHALALRGEVRTAAAGSMIIREGEPGDRFYVLLDGEASVTSEGVAVRTLATGDWFGEIALLHDVRRTATVDALGEVRLWSLERDVFLRLLGRSVARSSEAVGGDGAGGSAVDAGMIV